MFFSFPHIAIDSDGRIGAIARPNRPGASAACGALIKTMLDLKETGVEANCSIPGNSRVHAAALQSVEVTAATEGTHPTPECGCLSIPTPHPVTGR